MVNNYCYELGRQISIRLFSSDLAWLLENKIERNEFVRNLVRSRINALKVAPLLSADQSVPIIDIFCKGQKNQKSEQAAPLPPLRAYNDMMSHGNIGPIKDDMIERNESWSDETTYII